MGIGRRLGEALATWVANDDGALENGVALGHRFVDLLGADTFLAAPVRDLARRPAFQQALRARGLARRTALRSLIDDLALTYTPVVLAELLALLEVGLGEDNLGPAVPPQPLSPLQPGAPASKPGAPEPGPLAPGVAAGPAPRAGRLALRPRIGVLTQQLRPLLPGAGFGALMVLVLAWLARVVDQEWLRPAQASAGPLLALLLLAGPWLSIGPLRRWRGAALLPQAAATDPRQLWRWAAAPWGHRRRSEALLHALLLALILGPSPLPLAELVLRYGLTSIACLTLAALSAHRMGLRQREWGGAAGAVGALIGLAVGLSLLHRREMGFPLGDLVVPAWVLLVVAGSLELAWILPRSHPQEESRPRQRLLASLWWWGLVLGFLWAGVSGGAELLGPLLQDLLRGRPG